MSITISNCQQICHSPHNQSKAKMLYSFSRAERFPKKITNPCDKFYEINKGLSKRATGLGYDKKYDFTKDLPCSPPPNSYQINSSFDESKFKKKGFCFGGGRSQMIITGPLAQLTNNKNPAPGAYEIPSSKSNVSYSLRPKFSYQSKQPLKIPGPGTYEVAQEFKKQGRYFLSKHRNNSAINFGKSADRFNYRSNKVPGPGSYSTQNMNISKSGVYFHSKLHNSQARRFGSAKRSTFSTKNRNPGPGNYRLPSQFGHYMDQSAFHQSRIIKENSSANKQNKL